MNPELKQILDTMDIPELRRNDVLWLGRNLPINNLNHPQLARAMQLINIEGKLFVKQFFSERDEKGC